MVNTEGETNIFRIFDLEFLREPKSYREIQSKIIFLAHEHNGLVIPEDKEIKKWLEEVCDYSYDKYTLK